MILLLEHVFAAQEEARHPRAKFSSLLVNLLDAAAAAVRRL